MKGAELEFYRLREDLLPEGVVVQAKVFRSIKETPCGHWVVNQYAPTWLSTEELIKRKFAKWVSNTSAKRYCYPDIESAIKSFGRRKERQLDRIMYDLERVKKVIEEKDKWSSSDAHTLRNGINLGHTPTSASYEWDW